MLFWGVPGSSTRRLFHLLLVSSTPFSSTPVSSTPAIVCQYFYVSHALSVFLWYLDQLYKRN